MADNATLREDVGAQGYNPLFGNAFLWRVFAWSVVAIVAAFLVNNYLTYWQKWPGLEPILSGSFEVLSLSQLVIYLIAIAIAVLYVVSNRTTALRADSARLTSITNYIIRASFWMVFLVGIVDVAISFLRVEEMLPALVGNDLTIQLGRSQFRGPYIHLPVIGLALVIAAFTRGLAFTWLALLVVVAEFGIVVSRFIFSYEQAFMGDLVRFWYASLFLFASAFTLIDEGHVRVDIFYASFKNKARAKVNAIGSILLGMTLCGVIIAVGFGSKSAIINSPLLSFEVSQSGFGMYVKYLMALLLGIFAVSMMTQFAAYLLDAIANYRGDPGESKQNAPVTH